MEAVKLQQEAKKEVIVTNLGNLDSIYTFMNVSPLWAVSYSYCEEKNLLSALFASNQKGKFLEFSKSLPIFYGNKSISCGDWATLNINS